MSSKSTRRRRKRNRAAQRRKAEALRVARVRERLRPRVVSYVAVDGRTYTRAVDEATYKMIRDGSFANVSVGYRSATP